MIYVLTQEGNNVSAIPAEKPIVLPDKIYGDLGRKALRIWNTYADSSGSEGVLLIGDKGTGKTELTNILATIGLRNGLSVLQVREIKATTAVIRFLASLTNTVIVLDEFGKVFGTKEQEQMLTLLSDKSSKNLYAIADNELYGISKYIQDRISRIRYYYNFSKVDVSVVEEMCGDYNVSPEFREQLLLLHGRAVKFSVDQLHGLISEHINHPYDHVDTLVNVLNLPALRTVRKYKVDTVISAEDGSSFVLNDPHNTWDSNDINSGWCVIRGSSLSGMGSKTLRVYQSNIISADDVTGVIIAEVDGYTITLKEIRY